MYGRHELKYYINAFDYENLRMKLKKVAKLDKNASGDVGYRIRSMYFDSYTDRAVMEKLMGVNNREKFRIRLYNHDVSFIRLEKKCKSNKLTYKDSDVITPEECELLLARKFNDFPKHDTPLKAEFYSKIRLQNLRPTNIVEYKREVYIYHAGNVRVTLDNQIRTSRNVRDFLKPSLMTVPATQAMILEIKYDGFLPGVMRDILQINNRNQTEFSKYVVSKFTV